MKVVCEICGSNLIKQNGVFSCLGCGCEYSGEAVKELYVKNITPESNYADTEKCESLIIVSDNKNDIIDCEAVYTEAVNKSYIQRSYEQLLAIKLLLNIKCYKNSSNLIKKCRENIMKIEADNNAASKKDHIMRNHNLIFIGCIIAAVISVYIMPFFTIRAIYPSGRIFTLFFSVSLFVFAFILKKVILRKRLYNHGIKLANLGRFEDAKRIFNALYNYRDGKKFYEECDYIMSEMKKFKSEIFIN